MHQTLSFLPCNRIFSIALLSLLLGLAFRALAQFGPPIPDMERRPSSELITEGVSYAEAGSYEEAIEYYLKVNPSDTNYQAALNELTLAYVGNEQPEIALATSSRLFHLPDFTPRAVCYINRAAVFEKLGQMDKVIQTYQDGLEHFPFLYIFHYNWGIIEYKRRNFRESYKRFMEAVRCNPYHRNTLIFLGQLELNQGHFTKALLCFENAIMTQPNHPDNPSLIQTLEKVASTGFDIQLNPEFRGISSNRRFEGMDKLLTSKAALSKKYKVKPKKAKDFALIRQTQLIMENLDIKRLQRNSNKPELTRDQGALKEELASTERPSPLPLEPLSVSKAPWIHTWAPLHKAIYKEKLFKLYAYTLLVSVNDKKINKRFEKRKEDLDPMYSIIKTAWNTLAPARKLRIGRQTVTLQSWFDQENEHLVAIGNLKDGEREGYWRFFQETRYPVIEGFFQDGTRQGPWRTYHEEGGLREAYSHEDGQAKGFYQAYKNGQLQEQATYGDDQKLQDSVYLFYDCGKVKEVYHYEEGERVGENKLYYLQGQLQGEYQYRDGQLFDSAFTYYPNGNLNLRFHLSGNLRNGEEKGYHENGQLAHTGSWQEGHRVGKWVYYDERGRLQRRMSFDNAGNRTGLHEAYANGKKTEELRYFNGDLIGKQIYLDTATGNPYAEYYYSPGQIDSVVFYKAATGEVVERIEGGKEFDLRIYDSKGRLHSEGLQKGLKQDGNWTVYYPSGEIAQTYRLYEGGKDGLHYQYYPSGPLREITQYRNGEATGYAATYYPDGTVMEQGWLEEGKRDGLWEEFQADSTVKETTYWVKGSSRGWKHYFAPNGQRDHSIYTTENGQVLEAISYDAQGNFVRKTGALQAQDTLRLYHPDGSLKMEVPLFCHEFSDAMRWFYPNGQMRSEERMVTGTRQGLYRLYHPNGEVWIEGKNKDGKAFGTWSWFNEEGQLLKERIFKKGKLEGRFSEYYPSGQLKEKGFFHLGQKHGKLMQYSPKGDLAGEFWYEEGALRKYRYLTANPKVSVYSDWISVKALGEDTVKTYFQNGKKALQLELKNARPHGLSRHFYPNGQLRVSLQYENQLRNGPYQRFSPDGQPLEQAAYRHGQRHGQRKRFDAQGRLIKIQEYLHGELHGQEQLFNPKTGEVEEEREFWNGFLR